MTTLRLIGWRKGLRSVSLVTAIVEHAGTSLVHAKGCLERLLDGEQVALTFRDEHQRDKFRALAEEFGAIVEDSG